MSARAASPRALSVSELVGLARAHLEPAFADLWVQGEASNTKLAASGHLYLTLKDERAQLRVVFWRSRAQQLRFQVEDGLKLLIRGGLTIYEGRGEFQLIGTAAEPLGIGAMMLAVEQLKARLAAEGLFDPSRKRPLPQFPRRVAVVTSPTGAAIRDILNVLGRRHAGISVAIVPTRVQGEGAAEEIARAFELLAAWGQADAVIVGRGGGSIEDLWAFNQEPVARAIASCPVPVISAVGHEVDTTIADFVADLRAPTPSAAAELVAASRVEMAARLEALLGRALVALRAGIERRRARLARAAAARALTQVESRPARESQRLDELTSRLAQAMTDRLRHSRRALDARVHALALLDVRARLRLGAERLQSLRSLLAERTTAQLGDKRATLAMLAARLDGLSPLGVLGRGYAIATRADGRILRRADEVAAGDPIHLRLSQGGVLCRVEGTE